MIRAEDVKAGIAEHKPKACDYGAVVVCDKAHQSN